MRYRKDLPSIHFVRLNRFKGALYDAEADGSVKKVREPGVYRWPSWQLNADGVTWRGPGLGMEREGVAIVMRRRDFHAICRAIKVRPDDMMDTLVKISMVAGYLDGEGRSWLKDNIIRIDTAIFYPRTNRKAQPQEEEPPCAA